MKLYQSNVLRKAALLSSQLLTDVLVHVTHMMLCFFPHLLNKAVSFLLICVWSCSAFGFVLDFPFALAFALGEGEDSWRGLRSLREVFVIGIGVNGIGVSKAARFGCQRMENRWSNSQTMPFLCSITVELGTLGDVLRAEREFLCQARRRTVL